MALITAATVALVAACGSSETSDAGVSDDDCVIVVTGNKLCGADAAAYCEAFIEGSGDRQSVAACRDIGALEAVAEPDDATAPDGGGSPILDSSTHDADGDGTVDQRDIDPYDASIAESEEVEILLDRVDQMGNIGALASTTKATITVTGEVSPPHAELTVRMKRRDGRQVVGRPVRHVKVDSDGEFRVRLGGYAGDDNTFVFQARAPGLADGVLPLGVERR